MAIGSSSIPSRGSKGTSASRPRSEGGKVTDRLLVRDDVPGHGADPPGPDPREAWIWAQRICGVCTTVHAHTSVNAVEDALGIEIPPNAQLIRNLIAGTQHIQDHVIHFYHLHALDWVDVVGALKARSRRRPPSSPSPSRRLAAIVRAQYFEGVKARVKKLVASGQLGLFTNGYWGHPAYKLPPEANLMAVAHYLEALDWQRDVIRIHAVLGGKNPHLQTYLVGGMAAAVDPATPPTSSTRSGSPSSPSASGACASSSSRSTSPTSRRSRRSTRSGATSAPATGTTCRTAASRTAPATTTASSRSRAGIMMDGDLAQVHPVDQTKITEWIAHSYYDYATAATTPRSTRATARPSRSTPGRTPPYDMPRSRRQVHLAQVAALRRQADGGGAAGPDARGVCGRATRTSRTLVNGALGELKLQPAALFSTLGRVAARGAGDARYLLELDGHLARQLDGQHGERRPPNPDGEKWDPATWPAEARAGASTRRPAARSATGCGSRTGRSPTTRRSCHHLERRPARRAGPDGPVRGVARRHAGRGPEQAAGAPPDHPLVRPVPRLRGPRGGRQGQGAGARGGAVMAVRPEVVRDPPVTSRTRKAVTRLAARSTSGSCRSGSPTGRSSSRSSSWPSPASTSTRRSSCPASRSGATMMANIRFIHEISASCSRVASRPLLLGLRRQQLLQLAADHSPQPGPALLARQMGKYYSFLRRQPVPVRATTSWRAAYTSCRSCMFVQILTGILLFGWIVAGRASCTTCSAGHAFPGGIQTVGIAPLRPHVPVRRVRHPPRLLARSWSTSRSATASCPRSSRGYKNIRPAATVEALGLVGEAPEEKARSNGKSGADA